MTSGERERERERAGKVTFEAPFAAKQVSLHSHVSLCIFSRFVYLYLDLLRWWLLSQSINVSPCPNTIYLSSNFSFPFCAFCLFYFLSETILKVDLHLYSFVLVLSLFVSLITVSVFLSACASRYFTELLSLVFNFFLWKWDSRFLSNSSDFWEQKKYFSKIF